MTGFFPLALLLAPLALILTALVARGQPGIAPGGVLAAARGATLLTLGLALVGVVLLVLNGPSQSAVIGSGEWGLQARWDALSATMFTLVAFIGAIVVEYSRNYLDGDKRHGLFMGRMCLTLAAVLLLVVSGNLLHFLIAWIATSLALDGLLTFYAERRQALVAARKKFIVARIGDVCLIGAAYLLWQAFGTADIGRILEAAKTAGDVGAAPSGVGFATLLIVIAALLKSAQFPTHGWLTEVMETPTPVSALLHAGIINAGGFLVVRFGDVMLLSAPSLHVLALIGGFTALFGSIAMLTQTSVKVSLAYSTIAQMGFMLLQCGLGAFSAAVLHIVAHSLYKAHAFLSSGSVVELFRASWVPSAQGRPHAVRLAAALAGGLTIFIGIGWVLGVSLTEKPALLALGAILVLGLSHLIAQSLEDQPNGVVVGRTLAAAAGVSLAYFVLQFAAEWVLKGAVPETAVIAGPIDLAIMALAVGSFGAVALLQQLLPHRAVSDFWRAAQVHVANGFYANAWFNRLVGALKTGR
jgi:NAD(P)H-quinone oxidoreductase subunit 5